MPPKKSKWQKLKSTRSIPNCKKLLLPKDADDDKNIFIEVRAGTGGDEAALFAGDLLRMYSRYAERNRWQVEIVSANESELGGYKEVIARIVGLGAYSRLKFESGGHRTARSRHRKPRPYPHLRLHRRRHARSGRTRRHRV